MRAARRPAAGPRSTSTLFVDVRARASASAFLGDLRTAEPVPPGPVDPGTPPSGVTGWYSSYAKTDGRRIHETRHFLRSGRLRPGRRESGDAERAAAGRPPSAA